MKPFADYHTHTIHSDGKGTVEANVRVAHKKGLKEVGITNHGPAGILLGVKNSQTLLEIKKMARDCEQKYPDICVKAGVEANILNIDGKLDVSKAILAELDLVLAGFHLQIVPSTIKGVKEIVLDNLWTRWFRGGKASKTIRNNNTKAAVETVLRNKINIFTHPGLHISIDTKELARACAKRETAMEINSRHEKEVKDFVAVAMKEGAHFVISSDAHTPEDVGNLAAGVKLAEELKVPPELILNVE